MPETIKGRDDRPRIEVYNCAYDAVRKGKELGLTMGEIASLTEDSIRDVDSIHTVEREKVKEALSIAAEELNYHPRQWKAKDGSR